MSEVQIKAKGMLFQGARDSVIGAVDGAVVVASGQDNLAVLASGGDGDPASSSIPAVGAYTIGEQSTLVILVNFQDNPEQPWSLDEAYNTVFGDSNDFFLENSYGQMWLSGGVVGWYNHRHRECSLRSLGVSNSGKRCCDC